MGIRDGELSQRMQFGAVALSTGAGLVAEDQLPEWQCHELAGRLEDLAAGLRGQTAPVVESEFANQSEQAGRPWIVGGGRSRE